MAAFGTVLVALGVLCFAPFIYQDAETLQKTWIVGFFMACLGLSLAAGGAICLTRSARARAGVVVAVDNASSSAVSQQSDSAVDANGGLAGVSDDLSQYPTGPLSDDLRRKYRRIADTLFVTGAALLVFSLLTGTSAMGLRMGGVVVLVFGGVFRFAIWRDIHIWRE